MNFPYSCPQCGVQALDLEDAERLERICRGFPEACTLSAAIDEHQEEEANE